MPTYLDSTLSPSNLSLVDLVKKEQANEAMELELQLNFYVKGLPNYLAKKYVKDMTTRYDELTKKVETRMKELSLRQFETSEDILLVNSVKTISFDLKKYAEDIKKIKAALAKGERLETLYKTSTEYTTKFDTMEGLLVKIDKNLQLNNNKK